jgi:energy coupling factor transporter S component ThiW
MGQNVEESMTESTNRRPGSKTDTRKVALAVIFVAIGVALAPYTSFPIGIAKVNPTQHFINILSAVTLGPWWAVTVAGVIALIRNAMGVGTLLAFPGGMIGAFLAGILVRRFRKDGWAAIGEILGTGGIAPVVSAMVVAPMLMGKAIPLLALVPSFLASTVVGALIGLVAVNFLRKAGSIQDPCD